jgi:hypothetical protein
MTGHSISTHRRQALVILAAGAASVALPAVSNFLRNHSSLIRIDQALRELDPSLLTNLTSNPQTFDSRVQGIVNKLNTFDGKEPNQLFKQGAALIRRGRIRFELDTALTDPFTISNHGITIGGGWIKTVKNSRAELSDVAIALAAIGGALAYKLALEHSPIRQLDFSPHAAPLIVAILTTERMLGADPSQDLNEWHLHFKDVLAESPRGASPVEVAIYSNLEHILGRKPTLDNSTTVTALAKEVRELMRQLEFDTRTVGRVDSF